MTEKKNYRFEYDFIRFFAIICIVLFHFQVQLQENQIQCPNLFWAAGKNITMGQQGVALFFILAGAVSSLSYQKQRLRSGASFRSIILSYYKRRGLALFPMFWIAYFIAYLFTCDLSGLRVGRSILYSVIGMDGYLLMSGVQTNNLVGEWFLGAILLLYLMFPVLYSAIEKYPKRAFAVLVVYMMLIVTFYPFSRPKETDILVRVFDFCAGIYFGRYVNKISAKCAAAAACLFAFCCAVQLPADVMYAIEIQGICSFVVLLYVGQQLSRYVSKHTEGHFTARRFLQTIITAGARYSYAIFLTHHLVLRKTIRILSGTAAEAGDFAALLGYELCLIVIFAVILHGAAHYVTKESAAAKFFLSISN